MILNDNSSFINSSVRKTEAKAELYSSSALAGEYLYTDKLISFDVERVGEESKFFGFGICQKANIKLIDRERALNITTAHSFRNYLSSGAGYISPFPFFYVTEVNRDENTNELSITAYDKLNNAAAHTVAELGLVAPYTIKDFAAACADLLGVGLKVPSINTIAPASEVLVNSYETERDVQSVTFTLRNDTDHIWTEGWGNITIYLTDAIEGTASFSVSDYGYTNVPECLEREYGSGMLSNFWKAGTVVEIATSGGFSYVCAETTTGSLEELAAFSLSYERGANFDGAETLREALNAVAEATQTIYYLDSGENLIFKRLSVSGAADLTIAKADYFTLESKTNRRLSAIVSATELGDNVEANTGETGTAQYIRDNPFLELREDLASVLDAAIADIGGLTINQFNCSWRGNYLLEIGDKIALVTKDNATALSFVLNDTISYNGALSQKTEWSYTDSESESANNPTGLGEALKKTFARVDKANKEILLLVSEQEANAANITTLQTNADSITAAVNRIETVTEAALEEANKNITELTSKVEATITADQVQLQIEKQLEAGAGKVVTSTGFTFDEGGLEVSKNGSEITTKITEDGMRVYKDDEAVLTANNAGVNAKDLHATTYLIIGGTSRFEDYEKDGEQFTGCFWIGG